MRVDNPITSLSQVLTRDHDLLTGLADDDHLLYLTNADHDVPARHGAGVVPGVMSPVRKTADETVNNSTTLQNDDHLQLALAANDIYLVELFLLQQSPSLNSDFKCGWSYPAACTINGANAGTLIFQWAQNTATVEDTKVLTNSYLIACKLN